MSMLHTTTRIAGSAVTRPATVRPARAGDAPAVARTLASAFQDDPVFSWCLPDPVDRVLHLPGLFAPIADGVLAHGLSSCTARGDGAALWVPPEQEPLGEAHEAALAGAVAAVGEAELERFAQLGAVMQENHPHEPHLYLWLLGVAAPSQGRGVGAALLGAGLAVADGRRLPAYLEATSEDNRRLYVRHGFEVVGELTVAGSPTMWAMWREPAGHHG
jgi:ribosomal protein S18 acetylase RimI-like enzyme